MKVHTVTAALLGFCLGLSLCAVAQDAPLPEAPAAQPADNANPNFWSNFKRDLVQERVNLGSCKEGIKGVPGCAETLATGTPFHVAVGSLAPQNGVAAGLAFAEVYHPTFCASWIDFAPPPPSGTRNACHWSLNLNAEATASGNQSWRAGFYASATHLPVHRPTPGHPGTSQGLCHVPRLFTRPAATVNLYSEGDSLNRLYFYGLGPNTLASDRSDFGLTENVTGVSVVLPLSASALSDCGITLLGELNGRFNSVRGSFGDTSPSITARYTDAFAPGLTSSPSYLQAGEGIRLIPPLPAASHLKLNYLVSFQQFIAPSASTYSFRRFTADLNHRLILYSKDVGAPPRRSPPPVPGAVVRTIPAIAPTRDVTGSIALRLLFEESIANAGHAVPFFLDPTLGGSDINGQSILASYPDYRFRAPNALLLHGAFEHSLGKIPLGIALAVDEAKVALVRNDIAFHHLLHTYSAGLTVHAGGLPVLSLLFAWGGDEGHHIIANINSSLLGPGSRPSLF